MKKSVLFSAIVMIVLCTVMIAGGTFALFTSESETNITIQSGKVSVVSKVESIELYSMGELQQDLNFENGGSASFVDNAITLTNITPGDKVIANVSIKNESNVRIKYSISYAAEGELEPALEYSVASANASLEFNKKYALEAGADIEDLIVTIELPVDAGNDYQNKDAKIYILVEAIQANAPEVSTWDGTVDTSWYNDAATEFKLDNAAQIVGLSELVDSGNTFEGKTIKLEMDMDLYCLGPNGEPVCFDPIGSYRNDTEFKGTFDGQGHAIKNLYQNTWALDNGYAYSDLGLGFFGAVRDATIKNLVMDSASISGESAICGSVAATAYGNCTFENITVTNGKVNDYQYYAGGIVGWASGNHQYINCNVDESTVVGGQWGDFGNASGGLIGGIGVSGTYHFKDCTVACRIDAVNDVVSAYQWYCYRNCGMLIGKVSNDTSNGTREVVVPEGVTCENVTVIYNDWANYHYCEFAGTGYPYVRVEEGVSVDAYVNVRYGHPTDAAGNTVVDDNHVHNDGEDHMLLLRFDQLFGGPGNARYANYGVSEYEGVNVIYNNK